VREWDGLGHVGEGGSHREKVREWDGLGHVGEEVGVGEK